MATSAPRISKGCRPGLFGNRPALPSKLAANALRHMQFIDRALDIDGRGLELHIR